MGTSNQLTPKLTFIVNGLAAKNSNY